jgi:hypothetical protein
MREQVDQMKQRSGHHHVGRAHEQRDEENDEHGRVKSTIAFLNSCHLATSRWGLGHVRAVSISRRGMRKKGVF